jgi:hypothetical protein
MAGNEWHDINDPGGFTKKEEAQKPSAVQPEPAVEEKPKAGPEVRLSDPQWAKGADGFAFNKKAKVSVKVEYLKPTVRKRVSFALFVEADGGREDLRHQVDGFEKDGRAEAEVTLYLGDKYGELQKSDPKAGCKYFFKATHSTGEKAIESGPLTMPQDNTPKVVPHVKIDALDKWFIPGPSDKGGEPCTLKYSLSQADGFSGKVAFEVYASNYCKAEMKADYSVSFAELPNQVPIYSQEMPPDKSGAGRQFEVTDWNGKSTAADGALKPGAGGERFINVAFSPYTVHFRCFSDDADKEARIDLLDFWPRWNRDSGAVENESLKIKWKILKTPKFKAGKLTIVAKTDGEVFSKDLSEADLSEGDHEHAWDGALTSGGQLMKDNMPYRVQIQAWAADSEPAGVSAAAMHTEVRMFVHPKDPAHPHLEPNSLKLGIAPFAPSEPNAGSEEDKWYQYRLAAAGFHPGPIDGAIGPKTKTALREFQLSFPKNNAAPYHRLDPSGSKDNDTKQVLRGIAAEKRSLFGDPRTMNNISGNDLVTRLNDASKELIVWVNDRHYYTTPDSKDPTLPQDLWIKDYRGAMTSGDGELDLDEKTVARPYLPIQVEIPLLSRSSGLDAPSGTLNEASRMAMGPMRLNWAFEEIGEDVSVINTKHPNYSGADRTRKWVECVTGPQPAGAQYGVGLKHNGKTYTNGPKTKCGGMRPDAIGEYYKSLFALNASSLAPWKALDDSTAPSVCTLVHDALPDAAAVHASYVGKSGLFFVPSRIAGDGYRLRAAVSFSKLPGSCGEMKNLPVLKSRYDSGPKADSASMRIWRKSSFRAYVGWAPRADRSRPINDFFALYKPAHLHYVNEGANPALVKEYKPGGLISQAEYQGVIARYYTDPAFAGIPASLNDDYLWPFCAEPHLGFPRGDANMLLGTYREALEAIINDFWDQINEPLAYWILKGIEEKHGLLKGHVVSEYRIVPDVHLMEYQCNNPACKMILCEVNNNAGAGALAGKSCHAPGCRGIYQSTGKVAIINDVRPYCIGHALGCCWLTYKESAAYWAHEVGHNRHLEHCRSKLDSAGNTIPDRAGNVSRPGGDEKAQIRQHDSEPNPAYAGQAPSVAAWDRACVMSYNDFDPNYFCGKCILKIRGWAIEHLKNPPGNIS